MLYLVSGQVEIQNYGSSSTFTKRETRLVEANNEGNAHDKFIEYWNKQTSEYAVYYTVHSVEVHETIT